MSYSSRDILFYKRPKNEEERYKQLNHEVDSYSNTVNNDDLQYTFDSREYIVVNHTGSQTVIFLPEELYPDET